MDISFDGCCGWNIVIAFLDGKLHVLFHPKKNGGFNEARSIKHKIPQIKIKIKNILKRAFCVILNV